MKGFLFGAAAAAVMASPASAATLYSFDFDSLPTAAPGVDATISYGGAMPVVDGEGGGITGAYLANETTGLTEVTFTGLSNYTDINLGATLAFIDSWDSTNGNPSPDYLFIYVNGVQVLQLTSANQSGTVNNYGGGTETAFGNFFFNTFNDRVIDMTTSSALQNLAAPGGTLTIGIQAGGGGFQGGSDESWGLDNIVLSGTLVSAAVPEPATWAMMIAGFGVVGGAMRRRKATAAIA
jgi:hypothetical protein